MDSKEAFALKELLDDGMASKRGYPLWPVYEKVLQTLEKEGLPSSKLEAWKYTPWQRLSGNRRYHDRGSSTPMQLTDQPHIFEKQDMGFGDDLKDAISVSFYNGQRVTPWDMLQDSLPKDVYWIEDEKQVAPVVLEKVIKNFKTKGYGFGNLAFLKAPQRSYFGTQSGVYVSKPFVFIHDYETSQQATAHASSFVLNLAKNSEMTLIEIFKGGNKETFAGQRLDIHLEPGAKLHHIQVQTLESTCIGVSTTLATLEESSFYKHHIFNLGAGLFRSDVDVSLQGSQSRVELYGVTYVTDSQHIDNSTKIYHLAPDTTSKEYYKTVADGRGHSVFQGQIYVDQKAQKTDGNQLSKGLLLSPTAEIDSKPELEIYADDVKCSHGATVGELSKDALFYLEARGIDKKRAKAILIEAFLVELIDEMDHDALKGFCQQALTKTLKGEGDE